MAGGLGGAALQRAIRMGKMRHQVSAAACGVVMGLVIFGSNFGFAYLEFRNAARATGGFLGYVLLVASL